jgi:uncharacterized membrane protein
VTWFLFFSSGISAFVSCILLYISGSLYSSPLVFFFNTFSFLVLEVFSVVCLKGTKGYRRIIGIVLMEPKGEYVISSSRCNK